MPTGTSTPTRVANDIASAAAAVAKAENRSMAEQISHWARVGMNVERSVTAESRRVLAVITGEAQFSTLSAEERAVAHAVIDADIAEGIKSTHFGEAARRAGHTTVSVDENGDVVRTSPDGTRHVV